MANEKETEPARCGILVFHLYARQDLEREIREDRHTQKNGPF